MQENTSAKRKHFILYAGVSAGLVTIGTIAAVLGGALSANAATLATNPDTQIIVFMIPLTVLVLALMIEVARFALRGALLAQIPAPIAARWPLLVSRPQRELTSCFV
ncbi:MAG: hypothetical protein MO846_03370 [Candidatus Devosia symbiotica]|nr:hypothetical protein [Candidatus Devosia symbiotica]